MKENRRDKLRVAVVDDESIARARLIRMLKLVGGDSIEIVLECATAKEFLAQGPSAALDAAFVDIEMPGQDGLKAVEDWPGQRPQIVIATAHVQHALRAYNAYAIDYLTKPIVEERLEATVKRLQAYRPTASGMPGAEASTSLTARQLEILRLVADRKSNKEIGRALYISPFTVRNHLSALYRLFGVSSRCDLPLSDLRLETAA